MRRRRSRTPALAIIAFVVFCAIVTSFAVVGFRVSSLATSLARLSSYSKVIEKDVKATDLSALSTDIVHLNDLTQDVVIQASDPTLNAALDGVPFVGKHLLAARTLASAASGLTMAALPLSKVLPKLAPAELVTDGKYNVTTLKTLDSSINSLGDQLSISNKQIKSIPLDGLDSRLVSLVHQLTPALDSAQTLIGQVEPLVSVLPIMLAGNGSRTWFVALQNLAEARGTGGIIGAYSILDIDNGSVKMTKSGSDRDLIKTRAPLTGIPADFQQVWGTTPYDIRSVNVSPNFPITGQFVQNEWKAVSGEDLDGVLAIGQGTVQYMLAATGPITIDGVTMTAKNVVQFLSLGVYQKYPDATDKNAFVGKLVAQIFTRLQNGQFDLESLVSATAATPTSDRLLAWSSHGDVEKQITDAGLSGALPTAYGPTTAVAINNGGGNKLEQFLHTSIDYSLGACKSNYLRAGALSISLTNKAPTSGLPAYVTPRLDGVKAPVGSNREIVSIYAPVNSGNTTATIDGKEVSSFVGVESGRNLFEVAVELNPGQTKKLVVTWDEPTAGPSVVDVLGSRPSVITSPSLNPIAVTAEPAKACS